MHFVPAMQLVRPAYEQGYAIPSFCVWDSSTIDCVLRVAADCRAPVMLMAGPCEFRLLSADRLADTARALATRYSVPAALHLDHGDTIECAKECISSRYTSVMLDFSSRPVAENIRALQQVAALAHPLGITVEGEIGAVGRVDDITGEGCKESTLTDPAEAATYAEKTGVDMLAVSIGNAHGTYTRLPQFDFARLATLRQVVRVPLVLHGGSGTPEADLKRAISLGIAKVNVASELVKAVRETVMARWASQESYWAPLALAEAMTVMAPVIEKWIRQTGAAGRA